MHQFCIKSEGRSARILLDVLLKLSTQLYLEWFAEQLEGRRTASD